MVPISNRDHMAPKYWRRQTYHSVPNFLGGVKSMQPFSFDDNILVVPVNKGLIS